MINTPIKNNIVENVFTNYNKQHLGDIRETPNMYEIILPTEQIEYILKIGVKQNTRTWKWNVKINSSLQH